MRCSESLPPFPPRFVSFARRYHPRTPLFAPYGRRVPAVMGLETFGITLGSPSRSFSDGGDRASQVPGKPLVHMPCSRTPEGLLESGHYDSRNTAFRNLDRVGSLDYGNFGAESHGLRTRCLRFAGWVTPPPRKTRFRPPASFAGRGWLPAGSHYKVSGGNLAIHPPCPGFAWRNQMLP